MKIPAKINYVEDLKEKIKLLEKENARLKSFIKDSSDMSSKLNLLESLQITEERLHAIQSVGKIGTWEFFLDENKFWGSQESYHIFEITPPENGLVDKETVKEFVHADDREFLEEKFNYLLEEKQPVDAIFRILTENTSGIRETKYIKLRARPNNELSSKTTKVTGIIQDITEVKKYEKELIRSKEKAEESDKLKSTFLANMSHEIRTPMNAIIGFSELLNIGDLTPEKRKEYADIIKSKGTLLMTLIDDIIEVSKFESGHLNIHKTETNLDNLLNELYAQFNQRKKHKGKDNIELKLDLPVRKLPFIFTDPGRLQQVLSNLLNNALKFTDKGEIRFGYRPLDNNKLEFFVKDTGIGITREKQKVIFNRFRQLENTTARQYATGSGLGLTIAKGIVELLGGKIWVESELQKGTSFFFTIPYEHVTKKDNEDKFPDNQLKISNFNWKNKVILIAEDEEVNYKFLETVLHDTQAQVLHAENGIQAIELCKSISKIDLILMDIKMPILNGYEATREIKKINPSIPIIAQTAFSMKDDKEKCIQSGCDDYISKPIDIKTLLIKTNNLLNRK